MRARFSPISRVMSIRGGGGPHSVYLSYVVVGVGATVLMLVVIPIVAYVGPMGVDWDAVWGAFGAAAAGVVVIALLPWSRLFESQAAHWVLYAWSFLDIGTVGAVIAGTGGQRSWFWVAFILTTVFFSVGYPPAGQFSLLVATMATYLVAVACGGTPVFTTETLWRVAVIAAAFVLASFPAAELRRQTADHERARREADELTARLEQRERWWRALIEHNGDPIVVFGEERRVSFVSPAFERVLGYPPTEVLGEDLSWVVHPEDMGVVEAAALVAGEGAFPATEAVCRLRRSDGQWRHVEVCFAAIDVGAEGRLVANLHDVTKRVEAEEALSHQATHDPLTGLANSRAFYGCLSSSLAVAKRRGEPLALVLVDLDRFKEANDTFGHAFGDLLLVAVGRRLEATLREADVIARLGGDEFTAVLATGADPVGAAAAGRRLWEALRRPMTVLDRSIELEVSVGVACWPDHGQDPDELMRCADHAMYRAKRSGGGVWVYEERPAAGQVV